MIGLHLLNASGGGTVYRNNPVRDQGRYPDNYVPIANFPVRRPFAPGATELLMATRMDTKVTHVTYTEPSRDVQRGDRLEVEGVMYDVTGVLPPSKPHHLKVLLERREHGATTS